MEDFGSSLATGHHRGTHHIVLLLINSHHSLHDARSSRKHQPKGRRYRPRCRYLTSVQFYPQLFTHHCAPIGDRQSAPNQAPQGMSDFVDGSGPIFSMYLKMATEADKKMVENWKADVDGILIFVSLYLLIPCPMLTL